MRSQRMPPIFRMLAIGLIVLTGGVAGRAAEIAKPAPDARKYDTDIRPILVANCVKCHSGDKPKAKLKLDTLDDIMKGSRNGKVVIVGDSAKSEIVLAAAHATEDSDEWMPPAKAVSRFPALTADQIGLVRAWIDQGAK